MLWKVSDSFLCRKALRNRLHQGPFTVITARVQSHDILEFAASVNAQAHYRAMHSYL